MKMRVSFLTAVVIAVIALITVFEVLVIHDFPAVPLAESEISFYNLLVDIVVGVFTIWGLYWAASEFAKAQIKPNLRLILGRGVFGRDIEPLTNEADVLVGQDVVGGSQVIIGLFLENTRPKAAQYIRVVLCVRDVPPFEEFSVSGAVSPRLGFVKQGEAMSLQFGEDFVVYEGEPVYLGNARLLWPKGTHPEEITLVARLYSLESEPKKVTMSRPIRWIEEAT